MSYRYVPGSRNDTAASRPPLQYAQTAWQWLRSFLRPPRRLRVLRPGTFVIVGTFALGFATLNTGNNLLYLLLGALLGLIALSGWMSEQVLRSVSVTRLTPHALTAGERAGISYVLERKQAWLTAHDVEIREAAVLRRGVACADALSGRPAYVHTLQDGARVRVRSSITVQERGSYDLTGITISTSFPFGLFRKERDVPLPATLIVWPRTDRRVRAPVPAAARGRRQWSGTSAAARTRGEYRGLRAYRSGDERRDIHWRSSARLGQPVVREYEHDSADEYWIVVDTDAPDHTSGEIAVEIAAALLMRAVRKDDRCGLAAGAVRIEPAPAAERVDAMLDVLAALALGSAAAEPAPPTASGACVLVTARGSASMHWGDVYRTAGEA